jgi:hypothetical protein
MKAFILLLILVWNATSFANESDVKSLMLSYLSAIKKRDAKIIETVVTPKYYKILNQENQLQEMFKLQTNDQRPIEVDIIVKKVTTENNMYLVNFKDKQSKNYSHHWYVVIKENQQWKIDNEKMIEENNN